MKSKLTRPYAVLCADIHIRDTVPECRTDDFLEVMRQKFMFIINLALQHDVPLFIAGDLGNWWKWSHELEQFVIRWLKPLPTVVVIPGQHDLPEHNLGNLGRSALGVLHEARVLRLIDRPMGIPIGPDLWVQGFPYGTKIEKLDEKQAKGRYSIAMWHGMVSDSPADPLGKHIEQVQAKKLLHQFEYDLILTGDNHRAFVVEENEKVLVNPGSMMRSRADQIHHKPRVYLWYPKEYTVKAVYLPIEDGVITQEHINRQDQRKDSLEAFVNRIDNIYEVGVEYEENLRQFFAQNKTVQSIEDKVWSAVEEARRELGE